MLQDRETRPAARRALVVSFPESEHGLGSKSLGDSQIRSPLAGRWRITVSAIASRISSIPRARETAPPNCEAIIEIQAAARVNGPTLGSGCAVVEPLQSGGGSMSHERLVKNGGCNAARSDLRARASKNKSVEE
jgi:hypothetical protein